MSVDMILVELLFVLSLFGATNSRSFLLDLWPEKPWSSQDRSQSRFTVSLSNGHWIRCWAPQCRPMNFEADFFHVENMWKTHMVSDIENGTPMEYMANIYIRNHGCPNIYSIFCHMFSEVSHIFENMFHATKKTGSTMDHWGLHLWRALGNRRRHASAGVMGNLWIDNSGLIWAEKWAEPPCFFDFKWAKPQNVRGSINVVYDMEKSRCFWSELYMVSIPNVMILHWAV